MTTAYSQGGAQSIVQGQQQQKLYQQGILIGGPENADMDGEVQRHGEGIDHLMF